MRLWWLFLALTYAISWLAWVPAALSGQDVTASFWGILWMIGGFGPSIAGLLLVYWTEDRPGRRDFWRRVLGFRRISAGWYLFIALVFPITAGLALAITRLISGIWPPLPMLEQIAAQPLTLVALLVSAILFGAVSEELGWRGFGLDQLHRRWSPLVASLVIGLFWWAWHLPLFFVEGTTQSHWGVGSAHFWLFLLNIFPLSILITWGYSGNRRSILAAVLLHFAYNFTFSLVFPLDATTMAFQTGLLYLTAAGLALRAQNFR